MLYSRIEKHHIHLGKKIHESSEQMIKFEEENFWKWNLISSVPHPFLGDYVRLRQNAQWKKLCISSNDQYIVFADIINKITRSTGKVYKYLLTKQF